MKTPRRFGWFKGLCLLLLIFSGTLLLHSGHVNAATPSTTLPPFPSGFPAPTPAVPRGGGWVESQPNWRNHKTTGVLPADQWVTADSGTNLILHAQFGKSIWYFSSEAHLILRVQKDQGPIQTLNDNWSNNAVQSAIAASFGIEYATAPATIWSSGWSFKNEDIQYRITVPAVTQPTWFTYQIAMTLAGTATANSQLFRLLALPSGYVPGVEGQLVVFPEHPSIIGIKDLPPTIFPNANVESTPYLNVEPINGNQLHLTASGAVGATHINGDMVFDQIFGPAPTYIAGTRMVAIPEITVYSGFLPDQTGNQTEDATFAMQLPAGVQATNVRWFWEEQYVGTTADGQITLHNLHEADDESQIYAVADFMQNGVQIAKDVITNKATLEVLSVIPFIEAQKELIISGVGQPDSQTAFEYWLDFRGTSGPTIQWTVTDTAGHPTTLATISSNGTLTANADGNTGMVTVKATFTFPGGQSAATTNNVFVGRLTDSETAEVGQAATFQAPAVAGSYWPYEWQTRMPNGQWQTVSGENSSSLHLPDVQPAQDGLQVRAIIRLRNGTQTVTTNIGTLHVTSGLGTYQLMLQRSFLFVDDGFPDTTASTQAFVVGLPPGVSDLTYQVMIPGTNTISPLAHATAGGEVVAGTQSGTAEIVARFHIGTVLYEARATLDILAVPDVQTTAGQDVTLTVAHLDALPSNAQYQFAWRRQEARSLEFEGAPAYISTVSANYGLLAVSSEQDGDHYQLVITRLNDNVVWFSNVMTLQVGLPAGLSLLEVPNFEFAVLDSPLAPQPRSVTIKELIDGQFNGQVPIDFSNSAMYQSWLVDWNIDENTLLIADTREEGGSWVLSAAMGTFKPRFIGTPMPASGAAMQMLLTPFGGSRTFLPLLWADDGLAAQVVFAGQAEDDDEFSAEVNGFLKFAALQTPTFGTFESTVEWTLAAVPEPPAPDPEVEPESDSGTDPETDPETLPVAITDSVPLP